MDNKNLDYYLNKSNEELLNMFNGRNGYQEFNNFNRLVKEQNENYKKLYEYFDETSIETMEKKLEPYYEELAKMWEEVEDY